MRIEIEGHPFKGAEELRDYLVRRLRFALGRFGERISGVRVGVEEVNGRRGDVEITCWIIVDLVRLRRVLAEGTDVSTKRAIDRAVDRAERSVHRRVDRYQEQDADSTHSSSRRKKKR